MATRWLREGKIPTPATVLPSSSSILSPKISQPKPRAKNGTPSAASSLSFEAWPSINSSASSAPASVPEPMNTASMLDAIDPEASNSSTVDSIPDHLSLATRASRFPVSPFRPSCAGNRCRNLTVIFLPPDPKSP